MKFNLITGIILAIFSVTRIKSVNSQLDFGNLEEERTKGYYGASGRQEDNGTVRQEIRVGVDDGLLEPPRRGRGRIDEPIHEQTGSKIGKLAHLQIVPQSICLMKADPGYCNLIVGRWYYDHRYHRCLPFLYTGCGGNLNNFMSIKKCTAATMQCHYINTAPLDPLTKHALLNPLNPLGGLASDFILAG